MSLKEYIYIYRDYKCSVIAIDTINFLFYFHGHNELSHQVNNKQIDLSLYSTVQCQ